ncbi:MAG: bifunctional DNA primase/polymerase [Pseudohongiellaceae bacterium]
MTAQTLMQRVGGRLAANGYPFIPIAPGTKKPGHMVRGEWRDYPAWPRHCERDTTDHELAIWSNWTDAGIGIPCGRVIAVDIDIEQAELALELEALAKQMLGETPALRIGRAPKRLLVYRAETPFAGIKRHPIEILGLGQQFVAHGIHPDTGMAYVWPEEDLANLDIDDLPIITEAAASAFLDAAMKVIPDELKPSRLVGEGEGDADPSGLRRGTLAAIQDALSMIPNDDLDYDSWIKIGMALKGALGDEGEELFLTWSAQSAKDDATYTAKSWASLKPTRIGAGTIYHHAMAAGWRPGPELQLNGEIEVNGSHPARGMLDQLAVQPDQGIIANQCSYPEILDNCPEVGPSAFEGVLSELLGYIISTARRPQPMLALGASLCALGALMGRKYRTPTNLRSNLMIVGLAESGAGKNHAREVINELFVGAGLTRYLGGNRIASGAGLLTALHRQPSTLFQIDEFGMFLSAAADRRRSPRHITEILDLMTELYSSAGGVLLGAEYANRDGNDPRRDLNQPCLCLYGMTTPLHFWNALGAANVIDGSLARFLVLQAQEAYPEENELAGIRTAPMSLIEGLQFLESAGGRAGSNLAEAGGDLSTAPDPLTVEMDPAASRAFKALSMDMTSRLREAAGTQDTSVLARVGENAAKLALVRAVAADPADPLIQSQDADWAIGFARYWSERTLAEIKAHIADNQTEREHKRVLEIIRKHTQKGGITRSQLTRDTQFLDKRKRNEIIEALIEAGLVETVMRESATRPAMIFRAASEL